MVDQFLTHENTDLLWEVLLENEAVPKDERTRETFARVLPEFNTTHSQMEMNLMEMNKLFIQQIMKKIVPPPKESFETLVTHEEIHKQRKSEFEKEFERKQSEFMEGITKSVPETPNFEDTCKDEPILNMSDTIQQMIAERKLEIGNISSNKKEAEKWLHLPETSVQDRLSTSSSHTSLNKTNKLSENAKRQDGKDVRFIKIDDQELAVNMPSISLDISDADESLTHKKVSWEKIEENNTHPKKVLTTSTLFSKLKRSAKIEGQREDTPLVEIQEVGNTKYVTNEQFARLHTYIETRFNQLEQLLIHQNRS